MSVDTANPEGSSELNADSELKQGVSGRLLYFYVLGDVLGSGIYVLIGLVAGAVGGAVIGLLGGAYYAFAGLPGPLTIINASSPGTNSLVAVAIVLLVGVAVMLIEREAYECEAVQARAEALRTQFEAGDAVYGTVFHDCVVGSTLFMRGDEVEAAWAWTDPIIAAWEQGSARPEPYKPGTSGPDEALRLIHRDGRRWREIRE